MVQFKYDLSHVTEEQTKNEKILLLSLLQHDRDSFYFSYSVALLNAAILRVYGITDPEYIHKGFKAGFLHDIGKLGMSYEFINYPGAYTLQMYNEMKNHPVGGAELLEKAGSDHEVIVSTLHHHCNVDGSGYPGGFIDNELHLFARTTRISDSIDAFLSKRCYKEGGDSGLAYKDLEVYQNVSYDKGLLDAFKIVHEGVMDASRRLGEDRPSKDMYIHLLGENYAADYHRVNKNNLIDLF